MSVLEEALEHRMAKVEEAVEHKILKLEGVFKSNPIILQRRKRKPKGKKELNPGYIPM